jgi:SWI/SNF-related matrix-associated actin-dependent regulator 1 of chromatin subfamily A
VVVEMIQKAAQQAVHSRSTHAEIDVPPNAQGYTPRPYQQAATKYITDMWKQCWDSGREVHPLMGDEMGLGKTIEVLCAIQTFPHAKEILIVCPGSVKHNWKKEIGIWLNTGDPRWSEKSEMVPFGYVLKHGLVTVIKSGMSIIPETPIWIVNYDLLKNNKVFQSVCDRDWDVVIADEIQRVKNSLAIRSKKFVKIPTRLKVALSGTIANKEEDAWYPLKWLNPARFGDRLTYRTNYVNTPGGAYRLGKELRATMMIARSKKDVAKELPPFLKHIRLIEPDREAQKMIDEQRAYIRDKGIDPDAYTQRMSEHEQKARAEMEAVRGTILEADTAKRLREEFMTICESMDSRMGIPFEEISKERKRIAMLKIKHAVSFIKEILEQKDKLVVFYHHKDVGDALKAEFEGKWVGFDGSMSSTEKRHEIVEEFQTGDIPLGIFSLRSANYGINLQRADTVLFVEIDWNATENNQAADRIHRIGQKFTCTAYYLVFDGSIDARILQISAIKDRVHQYIYQ